MFARGVSLSGLIVPANMRLNDLVFSFALEIRSNSLSCFMQGSNIWRSSTDPSRVFVSGVDSEVLSV